MQRRGRARPWRRRRSRSAPPSTRMSSQLTWLASEQGVRPERRRPSTRTRAPTIQRRRGRGSAAARATAPTSSLVDEVERHADDEQQRPAPAMRAAARAASRRGCGLAVAVEGDAVKLHAVVDEAEAELLGDPLLQRLELLVDELDDVAGLDVDQMVVVGLRRRFVARAAVAEIVALEDARFLEQADGAVDGGDRDVRDRSRRRGRAASRRRDGPRLRRARAR